MSTRRIHFYKRLEFTLHKKPYMQPPYRKGDNGRPMLLMTYGDIDMESDFEKVKKTLYKAIYGQEILTFTLHLSSITLLLTRAGVYPQKVHCTYYYYTIGRCV